MATRPKIKSFLNTHTISKHSRFEVNQMKTFSVNACTPKIWPIFSPPGIQIFDHRAGNEIISIYQICKHAIFKVNWMENVLADVQKPQIWPIFSPPVGQIFGCGTENEQLMNIHTSKVWSQLKWNFSQMMPRNLRSDERMAIDQLLVPFGFSQ